MKSKIQKITDKIVTKMGLKKYESMSDTPKLEIKRHNASIFKQLAYNKLD